MDVLEFKDPLITRLVSFIAGAEFQTSFETFFLDNACKFDDEEEQKLEYMEIYKNFQAIFDDFIQNFIDTEGITEAEFSERCRVAMEEDHHASEYMDIILASMDYAQFLLLMKIMRYRSKQESEAEEKTAGAKEAEIDSAAAPKKDGEDDEGPAKDSLSKAGDKRSTNVDMESNEVKQESLASAKE